MWVRGAKSGFPLRPGPFTTEGTEDTESGFGKLIYGMRLSCAYRLIL